MATIWSMGGMGMCMMLLRNVPIKLFNAIKRQCTTTLTFNSSGVGTSSETFGSFLRWYEGTRWAKISRSFSLTGLWGADNGSVFGVGEGSHFFIFQGRPFWMQRTRLQEGTGFQITYEIKLTALGRSRKVMIDLVEKFRYRPNAGQLSVFALKGADWIQLAAVSKRPIETVIVDAKLKAELIKTISRWRESRPWYETRGLPYKLTYIFHGEPGTGKTSLIKALASHFEMNICLINLATMSDSTLERALSTAPTNSMIVIEDFDSSTVTHSRRGLNLRAEPVEASTATIAAAPNAANATLAAAPTTNLADLLQSPLTLSGLLNALEGVVELDGKLVFMTTNVYNQLDPALLRKGRVDYTYEIERLRHREIVDYVRLMFPNDGILDMPNDFQDILGCDLQDLYFQHHDDAQAFINAIPKRSCVKLVELKSA